MGVTDLGKQRARIGRIVLEDDCDWNLRLFPVGAPTWPEGTTAWVRFYTSDGTTLLQKDGVVSADFISFTLQTGASPGPADLPDQCLFKIRVTLPGDPTTEAVVWRGGMEKEK